MFYKGFQIRQELDGLYKIIKDHRNYFDGAFTSIETAKHAIDHYLETSEQMEIAQALSTERRDTLALNGNRGFQLMR